jgi:hypothetical protein
MLIMFVHRGNSRIMYCHFEQMTIDYICFMRHETMNRRETITGVIGDRDPNELFVSKLVTFDTKLTQLPSNIASFFPNLTSIEATDPWGKVKSGLKVLEKGDLDAFKLLSVLILNENDIEVLANDVFQGNQHLRKIDLTHNKLKKIGPNFIDNLNELETIYLWQNICIKDNMSPEKVKEYLKTHCQDENKITPEVFIIE